MNLTGIGSILLLIALIVGIYYVVGGEYYTTVVASATIILIFTLVFIGINIRDTQYTNVWPPVKSNCPDLWTEDSSGNKICTSNGNNDPNKVGVNGVNFSDVKYTGVDGDLNKKQWAINNKVYWDGLTNNDDIHLNVVK